MAGDRPAGGVQSGPSGQPSGESWADGFADQLGEEALTPKELGQVLRLARDVAHTVERKLAPLAAYLTGIHVGRRIAEGVPREAALAEAVQVAAELLPTQDTPGEASGSGSAPSSSEG